MTEQIISDMSPRDCAYWHETVVGASCTCSDDMLGERLLQDLRGWLNPPDPSTNHNIACSAHNERTATWVFNEDVFKEWESSGSLLWIHGKGMIVARLWHMSLTTP